MRDLVVNLLRGVKKRFFQYFGIVVLLLIAISAIGGLYENSQRISSAFYQVAKESGDFNYIVNLANISNFKDDTTAAQDVKDAIKANFNSTSEAYKEVDNITKSEILNNQKPKEVSDQNLKTYLLNWNFNYKEILLDSILNNEVKTNPATSKYSIEKSYFKTFDYKNNNLHYSFEDAFLLPSNKLNKNQNSKPYRNGINEVYITQGKKPTSENEVVINPVFAQRHNINLGDTLNFIKDNTLTVVGFGYTYWGIMGERSAENMSPSPSNSTQVFTTVEWMNDQINKSNVDNVSSRMFLKVGNNDNFFVSKLETVLNNYFSFDYNNLITSDSDSLRGGALRQQFVMENIIFSTMSFIVILVIIFIVLSYVKKEITLQKKQIGVMKALGYSSTEIALGYCVLFFLITFLSSTLGFLVGLPLQLWFNSLTLNVLFLPIPFLFFSPIVLILSIAVIPLIFAIATFLQARFSTNTNPLKLIHDLPSNNSSKFLVFCKKPFAYWSFKPRLAVSFGLKSFSKLVLVFGIFAFVSFLLLFQTIATDIFNNKIDNLYGYINKDVYSAFSSRDMYSKQSTSSLYDWNTFSSVDNSDKHLTDKTFHIINKEAADKLNNIEKDILDKGGLRDYYIDSASVNHLQQINNEGDNALLNWIKPPGTSDEVISNEQAQEIKTLLSGFLDKLSQLTKVIPGAKIKLPGVSIGQNLISKNDYPLLQLPGNNPSEWIGHNQGPLKAKFTDLVTLYNANFEGIQYNWKDWFNFTTYKNQDIDWIFDSAHNNLKKEQVTYIDNAGEKQTADLPIIPTAVSKVLAQLNNYKYNSKFLMLFNVNGKFTPILFQVKGIVISNLDVASIYSNIDDIRNVIGYSNSSGPLEYTFNHVYSKQKTLMLNNMISLYSRSGKYHVNDVKSNLLAINSNPVIFSLYKAAFNKLLTALESILQITRWLIIFALIFVLVIIINMILDNNISIIAMMKSLGYRINEINLLIIGSYIAALVIAYVLGTVAAYGMWNIIVLIVGKIAGTILVVPISPVTIFSTFAIVFFILTIGYLVSLYFIKSKPATLLLQG